MARQEEDKLGFILYFLPRPGAPEKCAKGTTITVAEVVMDNFQLLQI